MAGLSRRKALMDALVVGFAIFAIYFGAGNLIFPPYIGASTGPDWQIGLLGLTLAGILLPVLAVTAVANSGGTFKSLARPIAPWFYIVYNILVMIGVGALITIPRTSAVAFEIGVRTLVPASDNFVGRLIAVLVFFGIATFVAFDQGSIADRVGKILTPVLLLILFTLVTLAVLRPVGQPVPTGLENPFYMAFTEAYQMGDILTGLLCATIFVSALVQKGYRSPSATSSWSWVPVPWARSRCGSSMPGSNISARPATPTSPLTPSAQRCWSASSTFCPARSAPMPSRSRWRSPA